MRVWALAALLLGGQLGCHACSAALELQPTSLSQSGGQLRIRGELGARGAVVVLIDGIAAQSVVRESPELIRVRVPALPRTGPVDVELLFADGVHMTERGALRISAPHLDVSP